MMVKAVVFDMDGTLLHTLPDLAKSANEALEKSGYPIHDLREYESYMGDGGWQMIQRAMPPSASIEQSGQVFELWRKLYMASDYSLTEPFPGVLRMLRELRGRGVKAALLSNKFDEGVQVLSARFFPGLFDAVLGDKPPAPRKPDPTTLLSMLEELCVVPDETAYVGDARVDAQLARNAGVAAIGVSWGYDAANPLVESDLDAYIHDPSELLTLL